MKNTFIRFIILTGALCGMALAHENQPEAAPATQGDQWEFTLAPYLWMSGIQGKEGVVGAGPPVDIDLSFTDIAEIMDFGFMLSGELRKGKWAVVNDFLYLEVSGDATLTGPLRQLFTAKVELAQETMTDTLAASYRCVDNERVQLDMLAGVRMWYVDTSIDITVTDRPTRPQRPGILPPPLQPTLPTLPTIPDSVSSSDSDFWMDPVVGLKVAADLGANFSVMAGGFFGIGDSDEDWSLVAMLNYDVKEWFALLAGYRHMSVDYDNGGFVYDVEMSGPVLGAAFKF
ncbi:MAG: hypothetical protein U9P12_05370 [Verrucomicrobiota bacterium]|nr:hypothetical protein [Verrucomicrobiota bacterium]